MSTASRREHWRPQGVTPEPDITEAIEGLTDRVVAVRVLKEKTMSENEAPQPAPPSTAAPATPLPPAPTIAAAPLPARRPAAAGGFAASLREMMDEAREGVQRARAEGLKEVQNAVDELADAKEATAKVAGNLARTIRDEAADIKAELGQISNDL